MDGNRFEGAELPNIDVRRRWWQGQRWNTTINIEGCQFGGANTDGTPVLTINRKTRQIAVRLVGLNITNDVSALPHVVDGDVEQWVVPMDEGGTYAPAQP